MDLSRSDKACAFRKNHLRRTEHASLLQSQMPFRPSNPAELAIQHAITGILGAETVVVFIRRDPFSIPSFKKHLDANPTGAFVLCGETSSPCPGDYNSFYRSAYRAGLHFVSRSFGPRPIGPEYAVFFPAIPSSHPPAKQKRSHRGSYVFPDPGTLAALVKAICEAIGKTPAEEPEIE